MIVSKLPRMAESACKVLRLVEVETGIAAKDIVSPRRDRRICYARDIAAVAMNVMLPDFTLSDIAHALGRTDHSAASHALKRSRALIETDRKFANILGRIVFPNYTTKKP